jgi:hypothetical protein
MGHYITDILNIDSNSWILMLLMCTWGFIIIQVMVKSTAFAMISYPVLVCSSLAVNNLAGKLGLAARLEKAAAVAFSTGIGLTISATLLISLFLLVTGLYEPKAPDQPDLPTGSSASRF